jgi:hypothetical protein
MPWEASHLVLAVESYWHDRRLEENRGALTFRVAKWTWRVANALGAVNQIDEDRLFSSSSAPEEDELEASPNVPNEVDILDFAQEYALREMVFEVLEQPFVTKDLDLLLASTPWESLNRLTAYRSRRNALRIKHVEWHDPYRDWEDLGPDEIRKKLAGLRDRFRSEDRLASEGFRAAIEQLDTQTDGLLASQISRFTEYSNDLQGVPWWVNHLHETYSAWLKKHDDISFNI